VVVVVVVVVVMFFILFLHFVGSNRSLTFDVYLDNVFFILATFTSVFPTYEKQLKGGEGGGGRGTLRRRVEGVPGR
jgi:hypothetical protein